MIQAHLTVRNNITLRILMNKSTEVRVRPGFAWFSQTLTLHDCCKEPFLKLEVFCGGSDNIMRNLNYCHIFFIIPLTHPLLLQPLSFSKELWLNPFSHGFDLFRCTSAGVCVCVFFVTGYHLQRQTGDGMLFISSSIPSSLDSSWYGTRLASSSSVCGNQNSANIHETFHCQRTQSQHVCVDIISACVCVYSQRGCQRARLLC